MWWTSVIDAKKINAQKSVRKRIFSFVQLSLSLSSDIAGRCLCVICFHIRCHARAKPKNERTQEEEEKTGRLSMVTIRPSTVWCAHAKPNERENEKAPNSQNGRPNYQKNLFSLSISGPVLWWWVDFFRFNSSEIGRVTDHWRGNQRTW